MIGLLTQAALLIVTGISQGLKMTAAGNFVFGEFVVLMLLMLVVATLTSSVSLPFIFKLGVERGRTAYYVMIGFVCGASVLASSYFRGQLVAEIKPNLLLAILAVAGIGIYILSWYVSIVYFNKREIS